MYFRFSVFSRFLAGAFVTAVMMTTDGFAQSGADAEFHIPVDMEFFALHRYPTFKTHKALAVGPGAWSAYEESPSAEMAANAALADCNRDLRAYEHTMPNQTCVLFDVDGKRTGEASAIGEAFGKAAKGEDYPWRTGKEWAATTPTERGTMLLVHGCDGPPDISGWSMAWVSYYRAAGFRVILPNSFADLRDPATCGLPKDIAGFNRGNRNIKLRISQTLRTIAGIRRKYPGEPLYLHGHSEGGWVVQALGQNVSGIIITGTVCGFGHSGFYLAGKNVPLLVIAGTRDKSFRQATGPEALSSYCQNVSGIGKMTWTSVPEMGHYAVPWRPEVLDAVSKFLNAPRLTAARRSPTGTSYPKLPLDQRELYDKSNSHKAIAANKSGGWYWGGDFDNVLDAEEDVLYACDQLSQKSPFADTPHQHECALVDVDGKKLVE